MGFGSECAWLSRCMGVVFGVVFALFVTSCSRDNTGADASFRDLNAPPSQVAQSGAESGTDESAPPKKTPRGSKSSTVVKERYRFYIPKSVQSVERQQARPLLVVIHGCAQSAEVMQKGTMTDEVADENGFYVLYPDQAKNRHPYNCWRWFDSSNRTRGEGEIAEIVAMIDEVSRTHAIDPERIFVAGLSSGSGTAAALMACYPERFKGAALHSGPAFDVATGEVAALTVLRFGPTPLQNILFGSSCKPGLKNQRLLVIQGKDDDVVNPAHASRLMTQFAPSDVEPVSHKLKLRSRGELESQVSCYASEKTQSKACLVEVSGLKHAWSGGLKQDYFDQRGFSSTELVTKFLLLGLDPFEGI